MGTVCKDMMARARGGVPMYQIMYEVREPRPGLRVPRPGPPPLFFVFGAPNTFRGVNQNSQRPACASVATALRRMLCCFRCRSLCVRYNSSQVKPRARSTVGMTPTCMAAEFCGRLRGRTGEHPASVQHPHPCPCRARDPARTPATLCVRWFSTALHRNTKAAE